MDAHRGGRDPADTPEPSPRPYRGDAADLARQDHENLLAGLAGAPDAFASLYRRHAAVCFALASQILRDERLAQEAVQEAFVALWRGGSDPDPSCSSVGARLTMLTRRCSIVLLRAQPERPPLLDLRTNTPDRVDAGAPDWTNVLGERVVVLLNAVPPEQRRCLVLAYWGGCTVNEIAEVTEAPPRTVKRRLCAAMRRLRQQMDLATPST